MTRYRARKHIPGTPHTNCTKRTTLWNNFIHRIRSILLLRIFLSFLSFKFSAYPRIRRLLTPSRNYSPKSNRSPTPKYIRITSLRGIYYMSPPQPNRREPEPYNTSLTYYNHLRPLFYIITSLRILWNTFRYFGWRVRLHFFYSHRISRPSCYYWLNIFNRLLPASTKFPLHL